MKYTIESTRESEISRILYTAHRIQNNFYLNNNFFILPNLEDKEVYNRVIFPKFDKLDSSFWNKVKDKKYAPINMTLNKTEFINWEQYFTFVNEISEDFLNDFKNRLKGKSKLFESKVYNIWGDRIRINNVIVKITKYGTMGSYYFISKNQTIVIYVRIDGPETLVFESIINSIVHTDLQKVKFEQSFDPRIWRNKNLLVDYLMKKTCLSDIFVKHPSFNEASSSKTPYKIYIKSQKYLKELGFKNSQILSLKNNSIINNLSNSVILNLTNEEFIVLKLLVSKKNQIVTFDQIGDIIWPNEASKYSLYAISRIIFEIRKKLKMNGINKEIIQTQRKFGYYLTD